MSKAIKDRGESSIGKAEGNYALRFTNADIRRLQQKYGNDVMAQAHRRMMSDFDWDFINDVAAAGVKLDGQPVPGMSIDNELFEDEPLVRALTMLLDGLFVSFFGKTFTEQVTHVAEEIERMTRENGGEPVPLSTPTSTLTPSSEGGVSEPASTPTSSGGSAPSKSVSSRRTRRRSASEKPGYSAA